MRQVRFRAACAGFVGAVVLAAACQHSTEPTAAALRPNVYVAGIALDSLGVLYPAALVTVQIWPAALDTDSLYARFGTLGIGILDDHAAFHLLLGRFGHDVLDSVQVVVGAIDCRGATRIRAQRNAVLLRPYLFDTVDIKLQADVPLPAAPPIATGTLCGKGAVGTNARASFRYTYNFYLVIESITDSVRGRFDINYTASYGDDVGRFAAARTATELIIQLAPDVERRGCPIGRRIHVALTPDGRLGLATWDVTPCWEYRPFYFAASNLTPPAL